MSDYQVSYQSDSGYKDGKEGGRRKQGSPVRIFTTVQLSKIDLSFEPGYKLCAECDKWVSVLNYHCSQCQACTAKNGGSYRHCDDCGRCVKESWIHCNDCGRCGLKDHRCHGQKMIENGQTKPTSATVKAASTPTKTKATSGNKKMKKNFQKNPKKKQKMEK